MWSWYVSGANVLTELIIPIYQEKHHLLSLQLITEKVVPIHSFTNPTITQYLLTKNGPRGEVSICELFPKQFGGNYRSDPIWLMLNEF